ncbi:MAG: acyltransferase [Dactylosporangium sp.]|nr:acyltransferase [Dactylosporangium sp.]NNJ61628.1 acyltransferase [Dactylosporangium sp.]
MTSALTDAAASRPASGPARPRILPQQPGHGEPLGSTSAEASATASAEARGHIGQLTGIRTVAAVWVLLFHFRHHLTAQVPFFWSMLPWVNVGYLGVDLFFLLSGYILTYTHIERMTPWSPQAAGAFLWLRLARIWPVLVVMLLAFGTYNAAWMIGSHEAAHDRSLDPARLLAHLTLVHAWGSTGLDWNGVDWSLSAEWLAYLGFAVTAGALARLRRRVTSRALVACASAAIMPVVLTGLALEDGTNLMLAADGLRPGMVPVRVLSEFTCGALVAILVLRRLPAARLPHVLRPVPVALAILVAIWLIGAFDPLRRPFLDRTWLVDGHPMLGSTETVLVVPLLALLIAGLASADRDPITRLLASRPMVWGGRVSFALYMCHLLCLDVLERVLPRLPEGRPRALALALGLGSSVLLAFLLYRYVEEPCRKAMRSMLPASMRQPRDAETVSAPPSVG